MAALETQNLTKYYGTVRGIEDLTLTVEEGEIFGFIGPNGAGKTTTIRLLLGLIFPTRGQARLFDRDPWQQGPEVRRHIGYVPSEVFYYPGMKVGDLLHYAARFYPGDHTARLRELAAYFELDLERRIDDLSTGNRKKVGLVQGLLHRPRLLFLDEPTLGLDPLMQRRFFDLLREENRQRGLTVFFSSHILSEVQRLCTRVGIIRAGHLVEIADIRTLQQNSYKKVSVTAQGLTPAHFDLPGVADLHAEDGTVRFLYKGDLNRLVQLLSGLRLDDLTIEEPTLEEIFLHYYE
jgi:ABC-2 type transport system ATP-binding protein